MNNTIPTAEEFCKSFKPTGKTWQENFHQTMIEFAKFHVEAALKAVSEIDFDNVGYQDVANDYQEATSMAIINSYPLTNIK